MIIDITHVEWVKRVFYKMDVTGLVLSIGEKTTQRAIQSLERQTIPPKEIVLVENVFPFHKAMNEGVSRIRTPFFIQCDADMVLDPDCMEIMQKFIKEDVAVYIGYLSDDLLGKIQAVKMFRTECVKKVGFSNTISRIPIALIDYTKWDGITSLLNVIHYPRIFLQERMIYHPETDKMSLGWNEKIRRTFTLFLVISTGLFSIFDRFYKQRKRLI